MDSCLLVVDPPQSGAWNMAVDEALLRAADEHGAAAIRFYRWSEPTLSLGYFQRAADRQLHPASRELPLVRRHSGGGALIHDRELTYAIALPASHAVARRPPDLYKIAHAGIIAALAEQGVAVRTFACGEVGCGDATPCADDAQPGEGSDQFLCFLRRHPIDLVIDVAPAETPPKAVGSAQRRRRGALLQHGSILLAQSPAAPELPGIREASGHEVDADRLVRDCSAAWGCDLRLATSRGTDSARVHSAADQIAAETYGNASWTLKR